MRIDSHIHLYDPTRPEGVPWPPKALDVLYRPHLPADFRAVAFPAGITHGIVVEASPLVSDNDWLLNLVADRPEILGIIGNLDPREASFDADLARLARHPKFLGIRPRLHPGPDLTDPAVARRLGLTADHGLTLEFNVPEYPHAAVAEFARAHPNLRIVVTHLAGARLDDGTVPPAWVEAVTPFRELPNVFCKLSAFYTAAAVRPAPVDPAVYAPLLEVILDVFGPERVFFGSNWPVSKLGGEYAPMPPIVARFAENRDPALVDAFFRANTLRAYGLPRLLQP